jgi:hypothetical protein
MRTSFLLIASLLLIACSDDPASPDKADMSVADMTSDQSVTPDLADDMGPDQSTPDDMDADLSADDMSADMTTDDMSADMTMDDMSADMAEPDPRCMYLDLDVRYVSCGQPAMYSLLRKLEDPDLGADICPEYYTLKGMRYPTPEAAMAAQQCDTSCQYVASMSVSFLHCEQRNGYIKFSADGCDDILEFDGGIYDSLEQWRMSHPCPG